MQYDFNSWLIMYVFLLFPTTPQNFTRHFYRTIDFWLLHLHTIYLEEVEMIHNIMSSFFNDVLLNNVILGFLCLTAWAWFWLQALLLLLLKPQNVHFAWWPILTGIDILLLLIVIWFIGTYCICSLLFSAEVIYVRPQQKGSRLQEDYYYSAQSNVLSMLDRTAMKMMERSRQI